MNVIPAKDTKRSEFRHQTLERLYNMFATSHLTQPPSEFTRLIIYKFYLRNKPNLHNISSFAYQGNNLMRFIPLCRVTSGGQILKSSPNFSSPAADMLSFWKKNAGQLAKTRFHQAFCARVTRHLRSNA